MAENEVIVQTDSRVNSEVEDRPNLIVMQNNDGPLQGLKPVAPGVPSTSDNRGRSCLLLGQNDGQGAELTGQKYVILEDSPSGVPQINRAFSAEARPSQLVSGFGNSFLQQQILNTQQMCIQQQQAMSVLTDTVNKLQKTLEGKDKQGAPKRKSDVLHSPEIDTRSTISDMDVVSEGSAESSSSEGENDSDEEDVVSVKRQKLDVGGEGCTIDKEKDPETGTSKKLEKLKKLGSHFKKGHILRKD